MLSAQEMEISVYQWWSEWLASFLKEHEDERFTGLAAVCNPFNPGMFLCAETDPAPDEDPHAWRYESFDYVRSTAERFDEQFWWLNDFCRELCDSEKPRMREQFETFVEALMRAMIRVERELVAESPRFRQPADVFILFEDDDLDGARQRYQTLKSEGRLEPGWSKVIAGLKE